MNTKECIEFLEGIRKLLSHWEGIELDEVIKRLRMWEEFKKKYGYYLVGVKENKLKDSFNIGDFMDEFEEKYFPKKFKKKIKIEIEANSEDNIKHHINLIKTELKRNSNCPKIEYEIKECE